MLVPKFVIILQLARWRLYYYRLIFRYDLTSSSRCRSRYLMKISYILREDREYSLFDIPSHYFWAIPTKVVAICPDSLFRVSPTNLLGADLSLKLEIRWPKARLEAIVNGYHDYPLIDVSRFMIAEAYSSAIVLGVIIPCRLLWWRLWWCFPYVSASLLWCLGCIWCCFWAYLYVCFAVIWIIPPAFKPFVFVFLCLTSQPQSHSLQWLSTMVLVMTCKTLFPLVIMMPNLQTQLWWMESDLTVLLNPLNSLSQPLLVPLNSD